jgi:hypothetical protein
MTMKHLILNGFISPFAANDATDGFIELDEDQSTSCALIWTNGGAISAEFDAEFEPEKVAEINSMIAQGFAESAYGSAKIAAAEGAAKREAKAKAIEDAIKSLKNNRGK